jgi:hypothetical protein
MWRNAEMALTEVAKMDGKIMEGPISNSKKSYVPNTNFKKARDRIQTTLRLRDLLDIYRKKLLV